MTIPTYTFKTLKNMPDELTTSFKCDDIYEGTYGRRKEQTEQMEEMISKMDTLRYDVMNEFEGIAETFRELMSMKEKNGKRTRRGNRKKRNERPVGFRRKGDPGKNNPI